MDHVHLRPRAAVAACVLLATCASGTQREGNFSQAPGFAQYYAQHPRRSTAASEAERALLQRHRPRLWLPAGHPGPIDFYGDYIAQGTLVAGNRQVQATPVDRALLNGFKHDPLAVFKHTPPRAPGHPPPARVLARVDHAEVPLGERVAARRFTFLTYHVVFRASGLVAGLAWWQELPLRLVGDPDDWHQLDHYTAATVVLNDSGQPAALMLQQHNGLRTHVFGEVVEGQSVAWPADGRVALDVAIRSNELYAHRSGRQQRRAVDFVRADTLGYLIGVAPGTGRSSYDITEPAQEAHYTLDFLPPDDAFYSFAGYLGERRRLPGRDGPPGADFNTWPTFKPLGLQLVSGYWREGNAADLQRLTPLMNARADPLAAAQAQAAELGATLRRLGL